MKNRTAQFALSAIALVALSAVANAETVEMKFTGTGKGTNVKITQNTNTMTVFAGQLKHTIQNGTGAASVLNGNQTTFCSDIYEVVTSTFKTYDVTALSAVPDTAPMGVDKQNAIIKMYLAYGNSALSSSASNELAAAFQVAIWEIASDFNAAVGLSSLNLTSGNFKASQTSGSAFTGAIATNLTNLFAAAVSTTPSDTVLSVYGLRHATAQDQIVALQGNVLIPAPGSGLLAGLGILCMSRRRRNSK